MFEFGDHDLVAGTQGEFPGGFPAKACAGIAKGIGDEVQGFGGVGGPDDLVLPGADEAGKVGACLLEDVGCLNG